MNPQDPLAALHPLREPPPVGWWPPAPGWWLVAALVLLAVLCLGWYLLRRRRANAYRRQALVQLQTLREQFDQHGDESRFLAQINALLKSVALVAYPRRDVAASSGMQWLEFLNAGLSTDQQFPTEFVSDAYRPAVTGLDVAAVSASAETWIRRHEVST